MRRALHSSFFSGFLPVVLTGLMALCLQGCGVYFNTYFNAEKAYAQALQLREKRLDRNPEDTTTVAPEERVKLERAITKASKVLELWPNDKKYAPKAVFLIAESYLLMEEYDRAVPKYAEYIRYYPKSEKVPLARIHMAKAMYLGGQGLNARDALAEVLAGEPKGEVRREALLLSARMEVDQDSGAGGLALYEKLLDEGAFTTPETRAEAHWQAAKLAFSLKQWERARGHALAPDIASLPPRLQYRNRKLAILCLYEMRRYDEGIAEATALMGAKEYRTVRPDLQLLVARGREGKNEWAAADKLYRSAARAANRTPVSAEAFYRIGLHFWTVDNREDSARAYFDSAASAGNQFEFGELGARKAQALARVIELRRPDTTGDSARPHYRSFMIAEVFYFDLERPDSARVHLNRIVADTVEDTAHTRRAFYALAYIEETSGNKTRADSLYRVLMARYPSTDWAKQAEKNLGLPATVQTDEDKAHALFLEAERRRFAGENVAARVIPAYREVFAKYPRTQEAAKALFVTAFLREQLAVAPPGSPAGLDSAKAAYEAVSKSFPGTPYAARAEDKLAFAGASGDSTATGHGPSDAPPDEGESEPDDTPRKPYQETVDPANEEDLY